MNLAMRVVPLLSIAVACTAEARPAAYAERDSAGVRIVEYVGAPVGSRVFRLESAPVYRVGDEPGEREFARIAMGVIHPDGSAVVVDGMRQQELLLIAPDGAVRSVLARSGQGPNEIGNVSGIVAIGEDSVFVQDYVNGKMMVFEGETLTQSISLAELGAGPMAFMLGLVGYEAPGTALMMTRGYRPDPQEGWIQGSYMRFDLTTHALDTVGRFDIARPPAMRDGPFNPFGPFGQATHTGNSWVSARSDTPALSWHGSDGALRQIVRWEPELRYPSEEDLETFEERMRIDMIRVNEGLSRERLEQLLQRQRERMRVDSSEPFPLFGRLIPDGEGGIWLSDYAIVPGVDGLADWSVIAADGTWQGRVTLPDRFRILDVRRDRVLGVHRDSMDVESLAVYRILSEPVPR